MDYNILLFVHISSVILLLGVGAGSAFYKFMSDRSGELEVIVHINKMVVLADLLFTTPSVILQPVTGLMLMNLMEYTFELWWLFLSVTLYLFSVLLWFVAVWLQIRMKKMALLAQKEGHHLGKEYFSLVNYWIGLGIFSFFSMGTIFYLMIYKL